MLYERLTKAQIYLGNALDYLKEIPSDSVHLCITSSDYWQQVNHHGCPGQVGLAESPREFIETLAAIFDEVKRVLVPGGCLFQVMGDTWNNTSPISGPEGRRNRANIDQRRSLVESYLGEDYREKEPLRLPSALTDALKARDWVHRQDLVWDKGHGGDMCQTDRAAQDHEWIGFFHKPNGAGRQYNRCHSLKSSILRHRPVRDAEGLHLCPFPPGLARELILAASREGETILDPFGGSGTTAAVATAFGRFAITGDIYQPYCDRIVRRLGYSTEGSVRQYTIQDFLEV